jgi:hypothetical protein
MANQRNGQLKANESLAHQSSGSWLMAGVKVIGVMAKSINGVSGGGWPGVM